MNYLFIFKNLPTHGWLVFSVTFDGGFWCSAAVDAGFICSVMVVVSALMLSPLSPCLPEGQC